MDKALLEKLMRMARIELDVESQQAMLHDLGRICDWIGELQTISTAGIEPLTTLALEQPILREDIPQPPLDHKKALASSSYSDSNYFSVPNSKKQSILLN